VSVLNTIGAYKESRKRDKALIELATRANDPEIKNLLVYCLNEFNNTIRQAQEDPANEELMGMIGETAKIQETNEEIMASAVEDKVELVTFEIVEGKRQPKKRGPAYGDEDWDGLGRAKAKGKGKQKQEKITLEELDELFEDDASFVANVNEDEDSDTYEPPAEDEENDDDALITDSGGESDLEGLSSEALSERKARKEARLAMRSEIQEDEAVRRLKLLLTSDPSRVYTEDDLEKEEILKRSLELAYCARFGQSYDKPPSIHIKVRSEKLVFGRAALMKTSTRTYTLIYRSLFKRRSMWTITPVSGWASYSTMVRKSLRMQPKRRGRSRAA